MLLPAARLQTPREIYVFRNGPIAVHLLLWLLACRFGFRLENAGKAGSRFVEDPHKLGRGRKEQTKEFGLQDLFGRKIGKHLDLFGIQHGVVEDSRLDRRPLEFRDKRFENFGRGADVIRAGDHGGLAIESAVQLREPQAL